MATPVYATLALFAVPVLRDAPAGVRERTAAAVVAVVYLGWLPAHLAHLTTLPGGVGLALFLVFLVALNDVAAFVCGRCLGRHRLRPALSPAKTWEGAAGGLAAVVAAAWLLRWLVPAFGPAQVLGAAVLIAVGGTVGDLALAAIKRDLRIKDWSTAIPGHGGVLDRTNSLLFAAPLFTHFARVALG
jgi:phosphatidate cytidylyltransferase